MTTMLPGIPQYTLNGPIPLLHPLHPRSRHPQAELHGNGQLLFSRVRAVQCSHTSHVTAATVEEPAVK